MVLKVTWWSDHSNLVVVLKLHGGDGRDGGAVTMVVQWQPRSDGSTMVGKFLSLAYKVIQQSFSTLFSTTGSLFKTLFRAKTNENG